MKTLKDIVEKKKEKKQREKEIMAIKEDKHGYIEIVKDKPKKKINVNTLFDKIKK